MKSASSNIATAAFALLLTSTALSTATPRIQPSDHVGGNFMLAQAECKADETPEACAARQAQEEVAPPTEQPAPEAPAEQPAEAPAEQPAPEAPAEKPAEAPAEQPAPEAPAEKPAEAPAEKPAPEVPAEKPAEAPAELSPEARSPSNPHPSNPHLRQKLPLKPLRKLRPSSQRRKLPLNSRHPINLPRLPKYRQRLPWKPRPLNSRLRNSLSNPHQSSPVIRCQSNKRLHRQPRHQSNPHLRLRPRPRPQNLQSRLQQLLLRQARQPSSLHSPARPCRPRVRLRRCSTAKSRVRATARVVASSRHRNRRGQPYRPSLPVRRLRMTARQRKPPSRQKSCR